jgi:hypothetical protein
MESFDGGVLAAREAIGLLVLAAVELVEFCIWSATGAALTLAVLFEAEGVGHTGGLVAFDASIVQPALVAPDEL